MRSIPDDDDVSIGELREAVEHMHGVPARFVEAVEVDERSHSSSASLTDSTLQSAISVRSVASSLFASADA